jgi:uncharacterized protein YegL
MNTTNEEEMKMEPLSLEIKTLTKTVPIVNEETHNSILIRLKPNQTENLGETETKIALVLDNSGSMAGTPQADVVKTLGKLISHFRSTDWITCVAFGTHANTFYPLSNQHERLQEWSDLDFYKSNVGASGSTNMAEAFEHARRELQKEDENRLKRILILTDGMPNLKDAALQAAKRCVEQNIVITGLGFGNYDADFMDKLCALSNDTVWDMRDSSEGFTYLLDRLNAIQDQVADNIRLEVKFLGKHRAIDSYTVHPQATYNGKIRLDANRTWQQPLLPVQRQEGLEVLFNVRHPKLSPGRKNFAQVTVYYDVPSKGLHNQELSEKVYVEYSNAVKEIRFMDPEVKARYDDAFVVSQQMKAEQARKAGDVDQAVKLWGTIKKRGNPDMQRLAEGTIKKLKGGTLTESDARQAVAGTQKKLRVK